MAVIGKGLNVFVRWLWLSTALLIIGTAILVVLGRLSISEIDQLRPDIVAFISEQIGLQVDIDQIRGEWPGMIPVIEIDRLEILAGSPETDSKTPALTLKNARANLDLFNSIRYRSLIWRELAVDEINLAFVESADGRWQIKGFTGNTKTNPRFILNPLVYSHLIRLQKAEVVFEFYSGQTLKLNGQNLALENDSDFHRAEASVFLNKGGSPAYLVVEGEGDPLDLETFHADGYFRLDGFNVSDPLVDFVKTLMPELFANLSGFEANAKGEIWFDVHQGGALDFEGSLSIGEVPLDWLVDVPPITDVSTQITGWVTPGSDWGARLQGFNLSWSGTAIDPLNLVFTQQLGSRWQDFDISLNHLDVTLLTDLLRETHISSDKLFNVVDNLKPSGKVHALTLGHNIDGYYASALLDEVGVEPWRGGPGVKDASGYLEVNHNNGFFHLSDSDGFQIYFPKIYKEYLDINAATGTVSVDWNPEHSELIVSSTPMKAAVDAGEVSILFSVKQQIPIKGMEPEVNLVIGARDIDAKYRDNYLPYNLPRTLSRWLEESIVTANVKQFGLLYRNSPPKGTASSRTIQLLLDIEQASLNYHPDWTGVRDLNAWVVIDDGEVDGFASGGRIGDGVISQAQITYRPAVNKKQHPLLSVDGRIEADVEEAMSILGNSPLAEGLGPLLGWKYQGKANSRLQLEIPMGTPEPGVETQGRYFVQADIDGGGLALPESPIAVSEIDGTLSYSQEKGLFSSNIQGRFWGRPITAELAKKSGQQQINLNTRVTPDSLNKLLAFPWVDVMKGDLPVKGVLTVPYNRAATGKPISLQLSSTMEGVKIALPEPLAKEPDSQQKLDLSLLFDPDLKNLSGTLGNKLLANLDFRQNKFHKGVISYDRSIAEPEAGHLLLAAYLPTIDLPSWQPVLPLFSKDSEPSFAESAPDTDKPSGSWFPVFDLQFDALEVSSLQLRDIHATGSLPGEQVVVDFTSDLSDGQFVFPVAEEKVPQLHLHRLNLPIEFLTQNVASAEIDPREFSALNITVDQLSVGDRDWGSLSFEVQPELAGVAFNRIRGNLIGLKPGVFEKHPDTEFFWQFDGENHASRLVGPMGLDNVGDFLSSLDIPVFVDSKSGKLSFDLIWQDKPWKISKSNLSGDFGVELEKGSFYTSPGGAGTALKAISLFNFANWLRRLQFDFSDVFGQNLAYNSVTGTIHFDQGMARLPDPLKMKMPSGRMSMAGDIDLLNEQVDAQLVATLPVATNLPWVVALLGGLPAAAGVYLTSKLVQKQVDRLSSISYKLTGSWDDIEIEVNKIFAEELKNQPAQ